MLISQRSLVTIVIATFAVFGTGRSVSNAQQPEPLRLSSPPAHSEVHGDFAQAQQAQTQSAQGELLDVDGKANTLTIKTQTGEMTFGYNEQSKVTGAQKGVAGLATMTGSQVTVIYRKNGQTNLATSIDVKGSTPQK
jgi:hypothetical protein